MWLSAALPPVTLALDAVFGCPAYERRQLRSAPADNGAGRRAEQLVPRRMAPLRGEPLPANQAQLPVIGADTTRAGAEVIAFDREPTAHRLMHGNDFTAGQLGCRRRYQPGRRSSTAPASSWVDPAFRRLSDRGTGSVANRRSARVRRHPADHP